MHVATSRLTFTEEELWKRFQAWLQIEGKQQFSSDDFRRYGLHGMHAIFQWNNGKNSIE